MAEEPKKVVISVSTSTLLKIILVGFSVYSLYILQDILLMLLVSMILASAMDPLVDWLYRKARFPRGLSVVLVYLLFLALVASIIYFMLPAMVEQFNQLGGRIDTFRAHISSSQGIYKIINQFGADRALEYLRTTLTGILGNVFRTTAGVFNGFVNAIAVLVFTFYLISSESGMKNLVKSFVPFKHQAYAVHLTEKIQKKIGAWLLGQIILSGFIFMLTFIGLTALGVKSALALALLAGLLEVVPYLGPVLSAIPALFVAFIQSPTLGLFVVLLYLVVQQIENYALVPKIMGRTVGTNPLIILLAVLVGFEFAGIVGMLVSVPIVAAVSVFLTDIRERRAE